jgi:MinD superfamily P-loop ATPase
MWTQYRKQPHVDKTSVSVCRAARILYPCSRIQNNKRKKGKINKNQTQQPPKFAIRSNQTKLSKRKFQKIKNHQLDNRGKNKTKN